MIIHNFQDSKGLKRDKITSNFKSRHRNLFEIAELVLLSKNFSDDDKICLGDDNVKDLKKFLEKASKSSKVKE